MDNEREIEVQAPRSLHTLATGSCVERADRPDVRPVEQVVLDPNDSVVALVCFPPGLRVEDTDPPWPEPPVEPAPGEDRYRRTARVEADAARIEHLHPAVRAPQVFLVLASNEAPDIEPELRVGPGVKPQREQRDAKLGRPSSTVARDGDLPDTVPVLVQVVDARKLRVPQGAVRIGREHKGAAPVVEAVDQEPDVVVARKISVPAELAG